MDRCRARQANGDARCGIELLGRPPLRGRLCFLLFGTYANFADAPESKPIDRFLRPTL